MITVSQRNFCEQLTIDGIINENVHKSSPSATKIVWSFFRRDMLEQCPRRYYYNYYGANTKTAKEEPKKDTLRFLKTLANRYLRAGKILHLVIRTFFKSRQGEVWSLERLSNWARKIYRQDWQYSRNPANKRKSVKNKYPPTLLLEFHYQFENAEELYFESEQHLLESISNFFTSQVFADYRLDGMSEDALVEKPIYLKTEHFAMRGQVDLAYPRNGKIVVGDWKMGSPSRADESLQLLSYALWAVKYYRCSPDDVDVYRAHLLDDEVSTFSVSRKELQRAKARIIQEFKKILDKLDMR